MGCTGLTKGTAFPHCRIEGLEESSGALIRLSSPVDFDTADGELVDLVIGLMVPADLDASHYGDIQLVTHALADDELRDALRAATTSKELFQRLIDDPDAAESAAGIAINE